MTRLPRRAPRAAAPRRRASRIVRMRMPSSRTAVAPMIERILDAVQDAGLDQEQQDNLAVAAAEALSNAALHGNKLAAGRTVRVTVELPAGGGAVVEVTDSGRGFDAAKVSDPTDPARVLMPGGRGVFLMKRLVDRLDYNAAGNTVRLTVHPRK
jgi:anti-sigma regulatory factor (Ser/Thr protein kinase)